MQKSVARLILEPFAIAIVLALALRAAVRLYVIPSSSMSPTLVAGDHIAVTPFRFGARPERGDVIVFRSPQRADELMIKRVVAVPGDLVESREGRLFVSGHPLREPYLPRTTVTTSIAPQIVPAGCYFVLGDNRMDSLDSRAWGVLPNDLVVGKARLLLWESNAPGARLLRLIR